jgi:serine/threonine-protein kinase
MSSADPDARIGRVIDQRYRILAALAEGSMGVVYKAERVPIGKAVAIKFLHAAFAQDKEFLGRFERETHVMSRLAHPHCVSVLDFGVADGAPYLVMDYVAGTTLRDLLDDGPLPVPRALALMRQMLAGMAHAHELGVVHRDIKPANIMISDEIGTGDHVRILDFGLARLRGALSAGMTQSYVVVGTPNYMAPEQTVGGAVDARADVYAAGVILYEMITGERPFQAEDTLDLLAMHRGAPVPRLADKVAPGAALPAGLQEVVDRALAKTPATRYQSAIELAHALDEVAAGLPAPRRPSAAERAVSTDATVVEPPRPPTVAPVRGRGLGWLIAAVPLVATGAVALWYATRSATPAPGAPGATASTPSAVAADAAAVTIATPDAAPDDAVAVAIDTPDAAADDAVAVASDTPDAALALADASSTAAPLAGGAPLADEPADPAAAADPDPAASAADTSAEDEASDAPSTAAAAAAAVARAPATLARTIPEAVQLIRDGKRDLALASLNALWKHSQASAYLPFLIGNLYFDRGWWTVAMEHYQIAIAKNPAYKRNGTLVRNLVRALASPKSRAKAIGFLRRIGKSAAPNVRYLAAHDPSPVVRKQAAALAKQLR